jgi:hypothetical protein
MKKRCLRSGSFARFRCLFPLLCLIEHVLEEKLGTRLIVSKQ